MTPETQMTWWLSLVDLSQKGHIEVKVMHQLTIAAYFMLIRHMISTGHFSLDLPVTWLGLYHGYTALLKKFQNIAEHMPLGINRCRVRIFMRRGHRIMILCAIHIHFVTCPILNIRSAKSIQMTTILSIIYIVFKKHLKKEEW